MRYDAIEFTLRRTNPIGLAWFLLAPGCSSFSKVTDQFKYTTPLCQYGCILESWFKYTTPQYKSHNTNIKYQPRSFYSRISFAISFCIWWFQEEPVWFVLGFAISDLILSDDCFQDGVKLVVAGKVIVVVCESINSHNQDLLLLVHGQFVALKLFVSPAICFPRRR